MVVEEQMGANIYVVWAEFFNFKLGRFVVMDEL